MRRANREGRLHGRKVCRHSPMISHLHFTDDCLLFCKATRVEAQALKHVLSTYEHILGQAINYGKSCTFFSSNVVVDVRKKIGHILGIHQSINTGRYLGLPSLTGRDKKSIFSYIRD